MKQQFQEEIERRVMEFITIISSWEEYPLLGKIYFVFQSVLMLITLIYAGITLGIKIKDWNERKYQKYNIPNSPASERAIYRLLWILEIPFIGIYKFMNLVYRKITEM